MLTKEQKIYDRMLSAIGKEIKRVTKRDLTGFCGLKGSEYRGGLMVVGRAVNGWAGPIPPKTLTTPKGRHEALLKIFGTRSNEEFGTMSWVADSWSSGKDYNTARSQFWQVARIVGEGLGILDPKSPTWSRTLAWTNLYKISVSEGGNPSDGLCDIQFDDCLEALKYELQSWKPRRVLFMTDTDWFNGFEPLIYKEHTKAKIFHYVKKMGVLNVPTAKSACHYVIVKHPQGKKVALLAQEVLDAFEAI